MRISTSQFMSMNVQTMDNQQSQLAELYGEISSGSSLSTPSDNPLGAAQAVQLSMQGATLSQYSTNQGVALTKLQTEDTTLSSVTTVLQSVQVQLLQAGDGSLNDTNRSAIAATLQQLQAQLVTLGNATAPDGGYLFGGFQSASQPFSTNSAGAVVYNGDEGVQSVQISQTSTIATTDTGSAVFMSVTPQTSSPVPTAATGNTGTGTFGAVNIAAGTTSAAENDNYSISFTTNAGTLGYQVSDSAGNIATPNFTAYAAGSPIALGASGMSVVVSGDPVSGDSFAVSPAANTANSDVFSTIQNMITALQTPADTAVQTAALQNALATGLTQLGNTMNNVTSIHAAVGGREQEIQAMQTVNQTQTLQNTSSLADLTSTDMASTISKYTSTQYSLQAAEQAFAQVSQLSLFQYLNN